MPTAWRIVKTRRADSAWDGEGARLFGGRWNSIGVPMVYAAESTSLAMLETLVHLPSPRIFAAYTLIPVSFEENLVEILSLNSLPDNWRDGPATPGLQQIGDLWIKSGRSLVLKVPSAVAPQDSNYLINPRHSDFSSLQFGPAISCEFDTRLS